MTLPLSKIRDLSFKTSIYGIEERIVLDIGSCYLKCGFSGEARPREFISMFLPDEVLDDYLGLNRQTINSQLGHLGHECDEICNERTNDSCRKENPYEYAELYELDMMRSNHPGQTEEQRLWILEERLSEYLYDVYYKLLLTDPKQRKVIICESPLAPIALKQTIARVLFEKLQVPSISFISSHLLALLTTGTATGLVIDCGHLETSVLPIFGSRPMMPFIRTTPRAGKFLSNQLKQLLREKCPISIAGNPTDLRIIPDSMLTSAFIETIKTRLLFASPMIINARDNIGEDEMNNNYRLISAATEVQVEVWLEEENTRGIMAIPGWIRERVSECLFQGDEDAQSLTDVILETVLKTPSDLRRPLVSSMLLVGGTAQLPNLQSRLLQEIKRSIQMNPRWRALAGLADSVRFLDDLTPEDEAAALANQQQLQSSVSRMGSMTDMGSVESATGLSGLGRDKDKKKKKDHPKKAYQSSGKVFQPNCRSWIGGSLIGSLKASGPELMRENFNGAVPDWSTTLNSKIVMPTAPGPHHGSALDVVSAASLVASALAITL
ncbi:hypothetical protein BGW38_004217 [Lunasporangiospora selenospora]|uniref:Actin n=1 Tax=Lunasporangiospora selenospora TaxID=979761 RepID=A0A9P6FRN5_9FUNG|nr:hypothetical protein BGW38_004217 [Lunasporangiospora selenospora]